MMESKRPLRNAGHPALAQLSLCTETFLLLLLLACPPSTHPALNPPLYSSSVFVFCFWNPCSYFQFRFCPSACELLGAWILVCVQVSTSPASGPHPHPRVPTLALHRTLKIVRWAQTC